MSMYKIHISAEGKIRGYGPNVDEYQPYLNDGDKIILADAIPAPTNEELAVCLRVERDARLVATDKYLLSDYPISLEQLAEIKTYRQILRDLPAQSGAPWDGGGELTPWPEKPKT